MRSLQLCFAWLILGGCSTAQTPTSVCEHLVALREAAATKADPKPRAARMGTCVDQIKVAKEAMGEAEWKTFGPCAVNAKDVASFVACSPTMQQAAGEAAKRRDDKQAAIKERMLGDGKAKDGALAPAGAPAAGAPAPGTAPSP